MEILKRLGIIFTRNEVFILCSKSESENDVFKGIKFVTIPEEDIEGPIKKVWEDTVEKLKRVLLLLLDIKRRISL